MERRFCSKEVSQSYLPLVITRICHVSVDTMFSSLVGCIPWPMMNAHMKGSSRDERSAYASRPDSMVDSAN